jgi:hypothetical protein
MSEELVSEEERYCGECGDPLTEEDDDLCYECSYRECGEDYDDEDYLIDGVGFADPGGNSSLRAATEDNPRDCPCPTCGAENVLTRIDVEHHHQCNRCADAAERGW